MNNLNAMGTNRKSSFCKIAFQLLMAMAITLLIVVGISFVYVHVIPALQSDEVTGIVSAGFNGITETASGLERERNSNTVSNETISKDKDTVVKSTPTPKSPIIPDIIPFGEVKSGKVTKTVDGDTLDIDGIRIRLSLVNTPERGEQGYKEATAYTRNLCPVGSTALYDTDDKQQGGSHGRTIAKVWCMGYPSQTPDSSLNSLLVYNGHAEILSHFCNISEFRGDAWAQKSGC